MTQADLARRTGIDYKQINHYINNQDTVGVMGLGILRTIAEELDLDSPYDLYEMKKVKPNRS